MCFVLFILNLIVMGLFVMFFNFFINCFMCVVMFDCMLVMFVTETR